MARVTVVIADNVMTKNAILELQKVVDNSLKFVYICCHLFSLIYIPWWSFRVRSRLLSHTRKIEILTWKIHGILSLDIYGYLV